MNTALEAFVDLHVREYHRLAMMAKDAAAAGVLVLAVTTVIVLGEILWSARHVVITSGEAITRSLLFGGPMVVSLVLGLFFVKKRTMHGALCVAGLALLGPLAVHATDPFFALFAALLVVVATSARWQYPRH